MALKKQNVGSGEWDWLSELGFTISETRPGIWEFNEPEEQPIKPGSDAWHFRYMSVDTSLALPQLQECEIFLSFESISKRLKQKIQSHLEVDIICDVVKCKDGDVFVGVNAPIAIKGKGCPQSYLGFKFHVSQNRGDICAYFYDYLAIQFPPLGLHLGLSAFTQEFFGTAATENFDFVKSSNNMAKFFSRAFHSFFQSHADEEILAKLSTVPFDADSECVSVEITDKGIKLAYVLQNETGIRPKEVGLPVNALEIVELHSEYSEIIADISAGESNKTLSAIQLAESQDCPKFAFDLLGFSGLTGVLGKETYDYLIAGPYRDSLTAWSFVVTYLLSIRDQEKALDELSQFAAEVLKIAPESLDSHGFVLAELLGDLWSKKDPAVAHRFYRNVLKKYGDIPRILNKIVSISSKAVTADEEIDLLKKSLKIEEAETNYLARISDLYAGLGKLDEAIHFGVKALHGGYVNAELVLAITQLYLRQSQPRQALQLLDEYANGDHGFTLEQLAELHTLAGDLWLDQLNKPKLAMRRFAMAIDLCPQFAPVYERLERIYDKNGEWVNLVKLLAKKIEVLPPDDKKAVNYYLRICQLHLEQKVGESEKWEAFTALIQRNLLNDADIERSLEEDVDVKANWARIVEFLEQQLQDESLFENDTSKAKRMALLARIHHEKLSQPAVSAGLLHKANKFAKINTEAFNRLVHHTETSDPQIDPGEVLNDRIKHLDTTAKGDMLRTIKGPKDMALSDLRALAVQQFLLNNGQNDLFFNAFEKLLSDGHAEKFIAFLESALSDIESVELKNDFILMSLDFFKDKSHELVAPVSVFLFREFRKVSHDHEERARALAKHLASQMGPGYAEFLRESIDAGFGSLFEEAKIFEVMKNDPAYVVNFILSNPLIQSSETKKFELAKKALAYAKQIGGEHKVELKRCYTFMSTSGCLSLEEVEEFRKVCEAESEWDAYIHCLEFQMQQPQHAKKRLLWCQELGSVCFERLEEPERALQYFEAASMLEPDNVKTLRKIIKILIKLDHADAEKAAWQQLMTLSDASDSDDLEQFLLRSTELFSTHELERMFIDRAKKFVADEKSADALKYIDAILAHNIKYYELLMFKGSICSESAACLAAIVEATAMIDDIGNWYDHVSSAESIYSGHGHSVEELYRKLVASSSDAGFTPEIVQEIYVFLAGWLLQNTDNKADAFYFYGQAHKLDSDDLRVWLPYYFLMCEIGNKDELIEYLEFLIPELEINQDLLESHQITLQSLNADLEKLKSGLYDEDKDANVEPVSEHPEGSPEFNEESTFLNRFPGTLDASEADEEFMPAVPAAKTFASATLDDEWLKDGGEDTSQLMPSQSLAGKVKRSEVDAISFDEDESKESHNKLLNEPFSELNLSTEFSLSNMVPESNTEEQTIVLPSNPSALNGPPVATAAEEEGLELDFEMPASVEDKSNSVAPDNKTPGEDTSEEGEQSDSVEMFASAQNNYEATPEADHTNENPEGAAASEELGFEISFGDQEVPEDAVPEDAVPEVQGSYSESQEEVEPDVSFADAVEADSQMDPTYDMPEYAEGDGQQDQEPNEVRESAEEQDVAEEREPAEEPQSGPAVEQVADESITSGDFVPSIDISGEFDMGALVEEQEGGEFASANLETKQLEQMQTSNALAGHSALTGRVYNWRDLVESQQISPGTIEALMRTPFEKELEKHVAIQAVSLLSGTLQPISNWHMKVWRNIDSWTYSTDARDRIADDMFNDNLYNEFFRFLVFLTPVLIQMFDAKFTFEGFILQLGLDPKKIATACEPRSWEKGYLAEVGLIKYAPRFEKTQYQAFHLAGLGSQIFYDGTRRAIFFDEAYYRAKPVSFFLFGVLNEIWGVRLGYHVCLNLKPREEIFPILNSILAYYKMTAMQRVKLKVTQRKNPLIQFLGQLSPQKLTSFANVIASTEARDIAKMQYSMRDHLYKILLAESLNVIGLVEYITQQDLVDGSDDFSYNDMVRNSPHIESLVNFVAKLKL